MDLRKRMVSNLKSGMNKTELVRRFKLSRLTVHRYSKLLKKGSLAAKTSSGRHGKLSPVQEQELIECVKSKGH